MELFVRRAITAEQLFRWDTDSRTDANVRVNYDTALSDDAILAAVSLLAGDIAALPMRALVTDDTGLSRPLARQPSWLEVPDPTDIAITDVAHKTQVALSLLLAGNAYVLCEPSVFDPVVLTVLNPVRIKVVKPNRERLFEVMGRSGIESDWTPDDRLDTMSSAQVLHIPYMLRPGRLQGLSPVDAQAGNVGISIAMRRWVENFFGKGAQVSGFVSVPTTASNEQVEKASERIEKRWGGWRKAGIIGVLSGGAQWVKTGLSPQDADLDGMWRRQLEVAARIYGIPPFMIGSQEPAGVAYASSVERAQHYIDHCMNRYTRPIEKAYSRLGSAGRPPEPDTDVRFVYDAFLRGDPKARWETHLSALQARAITIDEVRALENRPPLGGFTEEQLGGSGGLLGTPNNQAQDPRYEQVGSLVRAGFDPAESLAAVGLPPIKHIGLPPVTVQSDNGPSLPAGGDA